MRILHLATDDKFIDQAFRVFEACFPQKNEVWVFSKYKKLRVASQVGKKVVPIGFFGRWLPKKNANDYKGYDLVIFHSFGDLLYPEIFNIDEAVPVIWIGWGYDYYDLIGESDDYLLPSTKSIVSGLYVSDIRALLKSRLGSIVRRFLGVESKKNGVGRVKYFSPVLANEFELVLRAGDWKVFPEKAYWQYGTIEDDFVKDFKQEWVKGDSVLVGNSATPTCNHVEVFYFLDQIGFVGRRVIAPLSYGNKVYGDKVNEIGGRLFGSNFLSLRQFMPIDEYLSCIKECGYVIMNHKRQQAIGNIVTMLYLGARVFLRRESPAYQYFIDMGVIVNTVQELEESPLLLSLPLNEIERVANRKKVSEHWSRESSMQRTIDLVTQALCLDTEKALEPRNRL